MRADKIINGLKEMRNDTNNAALGSVRSKQGIRWQMSVQLFRLWKTKLGFEPMPELDKPSPFRRPESLNSFRAVLGRFDHGKDPINP